MALVRDIDRIEDARILCGGAWEGTNSGRYGQVYNPSRGTTIARVPFCSAAEASRAVEAAAAALPAWSATPVVDRARIFFRFHRLMEDNFEALSRLITREHGKSLAEARAEMQRGLEMVEFSCGIPSLIMGQSIPNIAAEVDGETVRHPVGVCVGITPYNFPSMVPLWMLPVAIVCGNTFVLKPSEKVPLSAVRLGELLIEAGLPPGVLNIVHGDAECVETLLTHPTVAAVSFVGSTRIARHVYETATQNGKRVQAAGGAKNHLIIMPDADRDLAVKALAASAFGCSGQRCMAGSVAVTVGNSGEAIVDALRDYTQGLRVGGTDDGDSVDVGPLINLESVKRVESYLETAAADGARIVVDGREKSSAEGYVIGPSLVDHVLPHMRLAKEEVFGPLLSVIRADSLEHAIQIGKDCPFGNGASIFTHDGRAAREFKQRFNAGMIGINVGVPAPMAWLPFTGWNQSFFGDLHIQGSEGVHFYTRQKMTLTRWFESASDSHHDPVWRTTRRGPA
jgi:malonate-semialdehyde dehydrogenase (acetylating) / methylmalonate-semialdehyde dehydrogenase